MALDEIVQTCPVPLPAWLADSGGKGIQLIPVAHGEAQLRTRWGKDGAQVVLDTCGVKVWLPGITDTATLKMASELCGQAAFTERIRFRGRDGDREEHRRIWHDVMTPDMIRQLPAGHALVIRGSHTPVIARLGRRVEGPRLPARPPDGRGRRTAHSRRPRTSRASWRRRARHAQPGQAAAGRPRPRRRGSGRGTRRRLPGLPMELTMPGEPEGLTAVLLQLASITQKLAELDQRQAGDTRELKERVAALGSLVGELKGTTASHAQTLAALDGLDRQVAELAAKVAGHSPRRRRRRPAGLPAVGGTEVLEARRPGPRPGDQQAARVGRAGVPARLRPPVGQPGGLLGAAPAVPVHPGLAVRAVVGPLPRAQRAPRGRWPGRPNGTPGCWPPRPSSSPARPAAAPTAPAATAPRPQERGHDRPAT